MDVSVIIPTRGRPEKLGACVAGLAGQTPGAGRFEVLVGVDGGAESPEEAAAAEGAARAGWGGSGGLRVVACARGGQAQVRNALVERARGETLVFLNDDVRPEPGLLAAHVAAQRESGGALVVGAAPWVVGERDSLFARLVRETSMVFFYDRMDEALASGEAGRDHDWGFRHAWLLNLSAPAELVRRAGGFAVFPETYGYEDDEFAFRCGRRFGTRVLYRPEAVARHDHPMTPGAYLERERRLGRAAWGFAGAAPECALAMFGRDVRSAEEVAYARAFVERERANAERVRPVFEALERVPADALPPRDDPAGAMLVRALGQQHLMLKRWAWRAGLLEAAG